MLEGTAIKIMRENRKISQRHLSKISNVNRSSMSRIENNQQSIDLSVLSRILTSLNASYDDLLELMQEDTDYKVYFDMYRELFVNFDVKNLEKVYAYFLDKSTVSSRDYLTYTLIKRHFSKYDCVDEIRNDELEALCVRVETSDFVTTIDLKVVSNFLHFFSKQQIERLLNKILPPDLILSARKSYEYRNSMTQLINNAIDLYITTREFDEARKYLDMLSEYLSVFSNTQYEIFLKYYDNLISYVSCGKICFYTKLVKIVEAVKILGLPEAEILEEEVQGYYDNSREKFEIKTIVID